MNERRDLWEMSAGELAGLMGEGRVTAVEVVEACLRRIREIEETVQAWAFLDAEYAVAQAKGADERRLSGRPVGSLNGVPVGLKDIIDTAELAARDGAALAGGA